MEMNEARHVNRLKTLIITHVDLKMPSLSEVGLFGAFAVVRVCFTSIFGRTFANVFVRYGWVCF